MNLRANSKYSCVAEKMLCLFCQKMELEVDSSFKFKLQIIRAVHHVLKLAKGQSVTYGLIRVTRQPLVTLEAGVDECVYIKVHGSTRRLLIHQNDYDFYRKEYKRTRERFLYVRHSLRS